MKTLREEIRREVNFILENGCWDDCDKFISLFRQAIDEVIGEDEKEELGIGAYSDGKARNQLRAEQRERLNKIMPKE